MTYHNIDPAAVSALKDIAAAGKKLAEALVPLAKDPPWATGVKSDFAIPPAPISHDTAYTGVKPLGLVDGLPRTLAFTMEDAVADRDWEPNPGPGFAMRRAAMVKALLWMMDQPELTSSSSGSLYRFVHKCAIAWGIDLAEEQAKVMKA